uniref:Rapid ALkalinization Factor family protein n=1 Tax=Oryza punctata TaxID=4537 RepID=A0A0E0MNA4_ORYPU
MAATAVRSVAISLFVVALAVAAFAWSPGSSLAGGAGGLHHLRLEEVALAGGAGAARGRALAAGKDKDGYLSYFAAMRRDSVPCSRRGASYYNCLPGAPASPYNRSCAHITRCHG